MIEGYKEIPKRDYVDKMRSTEIYNFELSKYEIMALFDEYNNDPKKHLRLEYIYIRVLGLKLCEN